MGDLSIVDSRFALDVRFAPFVTSSMDGGHVNRRTGEVALIAIAIVLSLYGVLSGSWFGAGAPDEQVSLRVGLREVTICMEARCEGRALTAISDDSVVTMGGNVAFFAALLAAALGTLASGLRLAGKDGQGPISPSRLAAAFFAASALGSLVFLLVPPWDGVSMGAPGPMAIAGGLFGAVGSIMMSIPARLFPEGAPRSSGGLPSQVSTSATGRAAMAPACPQCLAPTEFVEAHARWFCRSCRAYA